MARPTDPLQLDAETADRLLAGGAAPTGSPGPYRRVAAVLAAAAAPSGDAEAARAGEIAAMLAAVAAGVGPSRGVRLPAVSFRSKVAAVGLAGALVCTGSLAAAGALPDGAQAVVQDVLGRVGIHVPGPNARAGNHPFERGKSGKPKLHVPGPPGISGDPTPSESGSAEYEAPGKGRGKRLGSARDGGL